MWPRWVELLLGLWLVVSPTVLQTDGSGAGGGSFFNELAWGVGIAALALFSFRHSLRYLHLGNAAIALGLVTSGLLAPAAADIAAQNHVLTGLTLLMFAIIPNHANLPPKSWRDEGASSVGRFDEGEKRRAG